MMVGSRFLIGLTELGVGSIYEFFLFGFVIKPKIVLTNIKLSFMGKYV